MFTLPTVPFCLRFCRLQFYLLRSFIPHALPLVAVAGYHGSTLVACTVLHVCYRGSAVLWLPFAFTCRSHAPHGYVPSCVLRFAAVTLLPARTHTRTLRSHAFPRSAQFTYRAFSLPAHVPIPFYTRYAHLVLADRVYTTLRTVLFCGYVRSVHARSLRAATVCAFCHTRFYRLLYCAYVLILYYHRLPDCTLRYRLRSHFCLAAATCQLPL